MNALLLVKQERFGEVRCDFYQNDAKELFMTREQIGQALGYADARASVANIHARNIDRLDQLSGVINLITPTGGTQETTVYTAKGIYEICRFSRQPKADAFMDWAWDVIDTIRKTGSYTKPMTPAELQLAQAKLIVELERKTDQAKELAEKTNYRLDSALDVLAAPPDKDWRRDVNDRIRAICQEYGLSYLRFYDEIYTELEQSAHVNIKNRQDRLKARMIAGGATKTRANAVAKLDVVERDPKLKTIFEAIVKKRQAKYTIKRFELIDGAKST
jgi:prophage antirepressor-like protein